MKYFTDPSAYHKSAASALERIADYRSASDPGSAELARKQAEFHLNCSVIPSPENSFHAPHMMGWPI